MIRVFLLKYPGRIATLFFADMEDGSPGSDMKMLPLFKQK